MYLAMIHREAGQPKRRCSTEETPSGDCQEKRDREDPRVDACFGEARNLGWRQSEQHGHQPVRQKYPRHPARHRQHKALDKRQSKELHRGGPNGPARRKLTDPSVRARQHQLRQVGACNGQNRSHGRE